MDKNEKESSTFKAPTERVRRVRRVVSQDRIEFKFYSLYGLNFLRSASKPVVRPFAPMGGRDLQSARRWARVRGPTSNRTKKKCFFLIKNTICRGGSITFVTTGLNPIPKRTGIRFEPKPENAACPLTGSTSRARPWAPFPRTPVCRPGCAGSWATAPVWSRRSTSSSCVRAAR